MSYLFAGDYYGVEAEGTVFYSVFGYEVFCREGESLFFGVCDDCLCGGEVFVFPVFDLYEYYGVAVGHYKVYLAETAAVVAGDGLPAFF